MSGKFSYGLVITIVGMGGTVLSLWFMSFLVGLLKQLFPYREEAEISRKELV